jgi:hypothetical protein
MNRWTCGLCFEFAMQIIIKNNDMKCRMSNYEYGALFPAPENYRELRVAELIRAQDLRTATASYKWKKTRKLRAVHPHPQLYLSGLKQPAGLALDKADYGQVFLNLKEVGLTGKASCL